MVDEEEYLDMKNQVTCLKVDLEALKKEIEKKDTLLKCASEIIENSIPKDAIREKIEELKDYDKNDKLEDLMYEKNWTPYELFQYILKELLGE